jgi:hypothetical protein
MSQGLSMGFAGPESLRGSSVWPDRRDSLLKNSCADDALRRWLTACLLTAALSMKSLLRCCCHRLTCECFDYEIPRQEWLRILFEYLPAASDWLLSLMTGTTGYPFFMDLLGRHTQITGALT